MGKQTRSVLLLLVAALAVNACDLEPGTTQVEPGTTQVDPRTTEEKYTLVADLAIEIMLTPEAGDEIIANNRNLFDSRFYDAIEDRIRYFESLAAESYKYCDVYRSEPKENRQCYQENEPAKNMYFLQTLRDATRDSPPWSQSLMGQASVTAKQAIGANTWVSLQSNFFAQIRYLFLVE